MPKQFLKNKAARISAIACIFGMSANTFVVMAQSVNTKTDSSTSSSVKIIPAATPQPTPSKGFTPAKENMTQQPDQGRRYGMSGFLGEPINLNVGKADVRDILNYITEQYGINFVIDSSVGAVPVTVNVQDVPWNSALEMILRSNKLGVQVNGNILRIATVDSLATEATTERVIKDAALEN